MSSRDPSVPPARPRRLPVWGVLGLACWASCSHPPAAPQPPGPRDVEVQAPVSASDRRLAATLLGAAPADWQAASVPVLERGPAMSSTLVEALRDRPGALGQQIAIAVLGELGALTAAPYLLDTLDSPSDRMAAEAALALGRLGSRADSTCADVLDQIMLDPNRSNWLRTAAASARFDQAQSLQAGEFLAVVILAGSPAGFEDRVRAGLRDQDRWALERTIAIAAIDRFAGSAFGLQPDATWPNLERGVADFRAVLAQRRAEGTK